MGGFAGGDEGGYWDEDSISILNKKPKNTNREKVNIQTKDGNFSYECISFVPCKCKSFTIEGCDKRHHGKELCRMHYYWEYQKERKKEKQT